MPSATFRRLDCGNCAERRAYNTFLNLLPHASAPPHYWPRMDIAPPRLTPISLKALRTRHCTCMARKTIRATPATRDVGGRLQHDGRWWTTLFAHTRAARVTHTLPPRAAAAATLTRPAIPSHVVRGFLFCSIAPPFCTFAHCTSCPAHLLLLPPLRSPW